MAYDEDLAQGYASSSPRSPGSRRRRPFDLTGRPMTGWILVAPEGVAGERALTTWVTRGVRFARSLPAKG